MSSVRFAIQFSRRVRAYSPRAQKLGLGRSGLTRYVRDISGDGAALEGDAVAITIAGANGNGSAAHADPQSLFSPKLPRPKKPIWRVDAREEIIGSSASICAVREQIALYAPESDPVLICGESGVGKEAVARRLHLQSPRKPFPFIVRNVGRVDRDLAGADFFGHARGAFTGALERRAGLFEQAHRGSLHLDEIAELPVELQANLLRVIEDGVVTPLGPSTPLSVDVRTIAATNADLAAASMNGTFRKDLYYRLAALRIDVPPLRDRGDDCVEIAEFMVRQISVERDASFILSVEARDAIRSHAWPGNVRELRNALRRAAIHVREGVINADNLTVQERAQTSAMPNVRTATDLLTRYLAARALEEENGVILAAARRLEINREKCGEISRLLAEDGSSSARLREDLKRLLAF